jgi:hypothetical protein
MMGVKSVLTTVAAAAALLVAPAALGATPQQVYDDMADNGRLDATYTAADVRGALADATVQGYGSPTVIAGLKGAGPCAYMVNGQGYDAQGRPVPATGANCQEAGGVLGAQSPALTDAAQGQAGSLPFTGAELAVFAVIGIGLLASGLILRRTARGRS